MNRHKQSRKNQNRKPNLKQQKPMQSINNSSTNGRGTAPPSENSRKSFHRNNIQSPLRCLARAFLPSAAAILTLLLSTTSSSFAGSATWKKSPTTDDWFTAANWTPRTIPNGPLDTAMFASSNQTDVFIPFDTEVNGIVFKPGASAFTIETNPVVTPELTISGVGITNNSGIVQNFIVNRGAAQMLFLNSATAGSLTNFTTFGTITFGNTSTAGNATFTNNGFLRFADTTTAGDATFTNNAVIFFESTSTGGNGTFTNSGGLIQFGEVPGEAATGGNGTFINPGSADSTVGGGFVVFHFGTGGDATFINDGAAASDGFAGRTLFQDTGDAGNATLIANESLGDGEGGLIDFATASTGGTAQVEVFGNGTLDISLHDAPALTTGSIKGDGVVLLGGNNLTVGTNNLSTTFSGVMQDGGENGGSGGSLTKTGTGNLSLANANTYTGGTTITDGTLLVENETGSATGTGAVRVNAGTLGGTGKISGAVTVATGASAATLLPGTATIPGTLTIQSTLTFNSRATYQFVMNSGIPAAAEVLAKGVTISRGAQFSFTDLGATVLPTGTVFTVISNTSANRIAGTFANLADRSTFRAGSNTFQVNYKGGDGNDLILTVVP
jgi:autotransporter-associated beta strand protein